MASMYLLGLADISGLLVYSWRRKIIELLSSPVEAEGDLPEDPGQDVENPENEYYNQALQAQGDGTYAMCSAEDS
jgi:E3 ubiquitin-protein ligase SHPRH